MRHTDYKELPKTITSPFTQDELVLQKKNYPFDEPLDVFSGGIEKDQKDLRWFDGDVAVYFNDDTSEKIYVPYS